MAEPPLPDRLEAARRLLSAVGQEHVLHFYDQLDEAQRAELLAEIESIDWPEVDRLVQSHVKEKPEFELPQNIQPAPWYPAKPTLDWEPKYERAKQIGQELIRSGKVAAFTVAGGQGTRLGWDAPKGTFPATPIRGLPLFACFAEYLHRVQTKYGTNVPWYVMTSPVNDQQTRAFFAEQDHFGLDPANIMIFPQQMMPAMDKQTGKVLMAEPGKLAMSPNGHGGSLKALWTSGAVADMTHRGIEQISYVQVDNPLVKMIDPLFLGLHAMDDAEMSSKMLPKAYPKEKLGNLCVVDGKVTVIEYSDLPEELAEQRREDGSLRFQAGSIAIHMMTLDFVAKLNESSTGFALPYHRAEKKVPYVDLLSGQTHKPESPNAVKLETFVFDALPMCERSIVLETERVEEFAPIKNADAEGCVDCPRSSKRLQSERAARWLQANGVSVPRDDEGQLKAVLEISQKTAIDPEDLGQMELPKSIEPNTQMLL